MLFLSRAARPQRVRETFQFVADKRVTLCMSVEVLEELRDVLTRHELRAKYPALTDEAVTAFLRDVLAQSELITTVPTVYTLDRDHKDSKYINLALAAGASFLVTRDLDLLDLMNEKSSPGREFRNRFPDLRIVEPKEFVQIIEGQK
jgi:putative PIN family toxin of toxin-antitoxin system